MRLGPAAAHERFEHAVEGTPDPEFTEDARIVARLRERAETVVLPTATRARIAVGLLGELGPASQAQPSPAPIPRAGEHRRSRFGIVLAAACCLLLVFGAIGVVASRDALPGQPFYGLKRGVENASLGLTIDADAQARKRLDVAANRVADLEALHADHSASPANYLAALQDFDSESSAAARASIQLGTNGGGSALTQLRDWARTRQLQLDRLRPGIPAPARARFTESTAMLRAIAERTKALRERLGCERITSGRQDRLGMLPATGSCSDTAVRAAGGSR
ncbi:DUF5667 domain-containing protein [Sciscionella sediminilitoris]|uniref:DUF5667 domain-containing protein n=1 Tax=Sciscionella sediminilitoris TaxID=1445613 RepID=UPI00068C4D01|nr:DUF5667 domain-containing protein [Sciscionella sp. SE31]